MNGDMKELGEAFIIYHAYGEHETTLTPRSFEANRERLIQAFGAAKARELEERIRLFGREIDDIKIDWTKETLAEATNKVMTTMAKRYPELSAQALKAIGWLFGYSNK